MWLCQVREVILRKQHKLIHNRAEFAGGFKHLNDGRSASAMGVSHSYISVGVSG